MPSPSQMFQSRAALQQALDIKTAEMLRGARMKRAIRAFLRETEAKLKHVAAERDDLMRLMAERDRAENGA